jgi:hypothetical protein
MDFDTVDSGIRRALNVISIAAAVAAAPAALFGGAWFGLAALGVLAASTGIDFAMDAIKWECDAEAALCEACSNLDDAPDSPALSTGQQPVQAGGKQWAASVAARNTARRSR